MTVQEWIDLRSKESNVRPMTLAGFYIALLEDELEQSVDDDLERIFHEPVADEILNLLDRRVDVWKMEQII